MFQAPIHLQGATKFDSREADARHSFVKMPVIMCVELLADKETIRLIASDCGGKNPPEHSQRPADIVEEGKRGGTHSPRLFPVRSNWRRTVLDLRTPMISAPPTSPIPHHDMSSFFMVGLPWLAG